MVHIFLLYRGAIIPFFLAPILDYKEGISELDDSAVQRKGEGIEGAKRADTGAVGSEAGYTLSSWEREGLAPLLEVR